MKSFNNYQEDVEDLRQKVLAKKEKDEEDKQRRAQDRVDDIELAKDTAKGVRDEIKDKLKRKYDIDLD